MKLSYLWLQEFVDLSDIPAFQLADLLTMKTCEVESVNQAYLYLDEYPVVLVEEVANHPNADKLKICKINTGNKKLTVVTGAPNVKKGKKYPLAPAGSLLPNGKKIEKSFLRGIESEGMLCSAEELALTDFHWNDKDSLQGILQLPDDFRLGVSLRQELFGDDYIIEIDNKSITHRPDLWSHYGFAREIGALLNRKLKKNPLNEPWPQSVRPEKKDIRVESGSSGYYGVCFFTKEKVNTPLNIQAKLIACGMRPVNFWVDVSNYVMLEIGQPTHAFSLTKLQSDIVVNYAREGEEINLLDGRKVQLTEKILLIRDGEKPIALAGVMGGSDTETTQDDEAIFLESATFLRKDIRHTVATLQIRTEASQRFEKGLSPVLAKAAISRYFALLNSFCQNLESGPVVCYEPEPARKNKITCHVSYIKERLGLSNLRNQEIQEILSRLYMEVTLKEDELEVIVPDFRSYFDLTIPEDLVEEVGRVIGYKEIYPTPLMVPCTVPQRKNYLRELEHFLRQLFALRYHFTEVYNYHFCTEEELLIDDRYSQKAISLLNPLQKEQKYLRRSPLVMLLRNIKENMKGYPNLRFFEIERIFLPRENRELPQEKIFLSAIEMALKEPKEIFRELLSLCGDLLKELGFYDDFDQIPLKEKIFHPTRAVAFSYQNRVILRAGQIHPAITDRLKIVKPLFYLEIFLEDVLEKYKSKSTPYHSPPKYPASDFEITVIAPQKTPIKEILAVVGKKENPPKEDRVYLEEVRYLYSYEGPQIGEGKKAVSLKVCWRNPARTLKPQEIKSLQDQLVDKMARAGFYLRQ